MDDIKKDPFEEYIRQTEPSKRELGYAWYTAMGLQAVDGLETSDYLKETARKNIEVFCSAVHRDSQAIVCRSLFSCRQYSRFQYFQERVGFGW